MVHDDAAIPRRNAILSPDGGGVAFVVRVTSRGSVTLPVEIREVTGIRPGDVVELAIVNIYPVGSGSKEDGW